VFVGRHYLAWIDQTGFYGKMNGLWQLNGVAGEGLDFLLADADGRPVSMFAVAENGDGRWAPGYAGAEHFEFPNRTPEADDPAACAGTDWCNQYGLNEAAPIDNGKVPWWQACNRAKPGWTELHRPIAVEPIEGGLRLLFEGPSVKVADGDGRWDGDACGQDYLFEDGVRRRVWLQAGYELFGDRPYFHRLARFRNAPGNPAFSGHMGLIGGFVVTAWPDSHYLKALGNYIRPELRTVEDARQKVSFAGGSWSARGFPPGPADRVFAGLDQPISLSVAPGYVPGRTATLAHVGEQDNGDVGICFCSGHGGLELGGGLLHGGISLPVEGGGATGWAVRRIALAAGAETVRVRGWSFEARATLRQQEETSRADGWSARPASGKARRIMSGTIPVPPMSGSAQAAFLFTPAGNSPCGSPVATIELYDATTREVLGRRVLRRRDFGAPRAFQRFAVNADLGGRGGHQLQARVRHHGAGHLKLRRILVNLAENPAEPRETPDSPVR
jgi:hypothetical protein